MKTYDRPVRLENVPVTELGALARSLSDAGWQWSRNGADWIAHFSKDFPDGTSAAEAEGDIAVIMGDYYVAVFGQRKDTGDA